jgi:hypothetical protein
MNRPGFKPFLSDEARDALLAEEEQREKDVVARALTERERRDRDAVCAAARVLLLEVVGLLRSAHAPGGFTSGEVIERLGLRCVDPEQARAAEGVRILIGELEGRGDLRIAKNAHDDRFRLAYRPSDCRRRWDDHAADDPARPANRYFASDAISRGSPQRAAESAEGETG